MTKAELIGKLTRYADTDEVLVMTGFSLRVGVSPTVSHIASVDTFKDGPRAGRPVLTLDRMAIDGEEEA